MTTPRAMQKFFNYSDDNSDSSDKDFSSNDSIMDPDYEDDGCDSETLENEEILVSK